MNCRCTSGEEGKAELCAFHQEHENEAVSAERERCVKVIEAADEPYEGSSYEGVIQSFKRSLISAINKVAQ